MSVVVLSCPECPVSSIPLTSGSYNLPKPHPWWTLGQFWGRDNRDVPIVAEKSNNIYSLYFDQL